MAVTASSRDLMTEGSVRRKIIRFALPVFLGNLFQQLYNIVDSVIVGNYLGSNALAAVSSSGNLILLAIGFFYGLSAGAGVVISGYIGARDEEHTKLSVHTTVAMGLVCSGILTILGMFGAPVILRLMNTPEMVLPQSITYFRIYFAGSLGFIMYNNFVGILQASGDSRHPLYYLLTASVINLILDWVLIAVFHFGVGAAAFATAVSQMISALLAFRRLVCVEASYRIDPQKIGIHGPTLRKIIHYGIPSGIQNSIIGLSNVVIQSYINGYGEFAMAGIGAYTKVEGFAFLPVSSFAMAITTFVGQNIGAGKYDRTRKGIRFGIFTALIVAEGIGILFYAFAPQLMRIFDSNPEVIAYGVARARIVTPVFFLVAFTHLMSAVLRGSGKPAVPMVVFLVCWCAMRVLILAVAEQFVHSVYTTMWVYPITWTLSAVSLLIYYRCKGAVREV